MNQPKGNQKTKRILAALAGSLLLLQLAVASPAAAAVTTSTSTITLTATPMGDSATTNVSWGGCGGCGQ